MDTCTNSEITWNVLLESIKNSLKDEKVNKTEVSRLLSAYKSREEDWMQYVFFDEECYTRNLIDEGNGNYNLMILAWNPSQGSSIHSHANSSCFVKILSGAIKEIRYEVPEKGQDIAEKDIAVKEIEHYVRERDQVTYIDDSIGVHEMKNETANQVVTLHLYVPPYDMCYSYDRETGEVLTTPMTFSSVFGVPQ